MGALVIHDPVRCPDAQENFHPRTFLLFISAHVCEIFISVRFRKRFHHLVINGLATTPAKKRVRKNMVDARNPLFIQKWFYVSIRIHVSITVHALLKGHDKNYIYHDINTY